MNESDVFRTIWILRIQFVISCSSPRKLVVTASVGHSVVPDPHNLLLFVDDASSDLRIRIFAALSTQKRHSHEILGPRQVVLPLRGGSGRLLPGCLATARTENVDAVFLRGQLAEGLIPFMIRVGSVQLCQLRRLLQHGIS